MTGVIVQAELKVGAQAIVDASGVATIRLAPQGENWNVERLSVKVSSRVLESVATYYLVAISDENFQEDTQAGSTGDTTDTPMFVTDGTPIWVQWVGADVGATATVTLKGTRTTPVGGFRAVPAGGL